MSSFPKQTKTILQRSAGKPLGQRILDSNQGGKFLEAGEHDVRVTVVDRNQLESNKLTITYATSDGKEHRDMLYWTEQDRKTGDVDFSRRLNNTLAALLPSTEAIDAFFAEVDADNAEVLDLLVGMKAKIILKLGKGYTINSARDPNTGLYGYQAIDTTSGDLIAEDTSVQNVKASAEGCGLKRAYPNVVKYLATHGDDNVELFTKGLAALHQPKAGASTFSIGKQPPKKPIGVDSIPF